MKKQEPYRDNRFDVGRVTAILNNIKKNDKTMGYLDQLQAIIEKLQSIWDNDKLGERLIYKDKDGNEKEQEIFWDELYYFVTLNQDHLLRESQYEYDNYNILTRESKLDKARRALCTN
jgi:hypothetical protein